MNGALASAPETNPGSVPGTPGSPFLGHRRPFFDSSVVSQPVKDGLGVNLELRPAGPHSGNPARIKLYMSDNQLNILPRN
jgi:hypothetical protein